MNDAPMYDWRLCVLSSDIPPTTRHVLLTLSTHMTPWGDSCFPTINQIVYETGLGRSTVISHIKKAEALGWIKIEEHGFGGQKWRNHEYKPIKPEGAQAIKWKDTEEYRKKHRGSLNDTCDEAQKVVQLTEEDIKGGPAPDKGGPANEQRWSSSETKVVQQVDPSIPISSSISNSVSDTDIGSGKPKARQKKRARRQFVLPDWIPEEKWSDYIESRKDKNHPMAAGSLSMCVKAIESVVVSGIPIDTVMDRMIEAGWRSCKPEWFHDKPAKSRSPEDKNAAADAFAEAIRLEYENEAR